MSQMAQYDMMQLLYLNLHLENYFYLSFLFQFSIVLQSNMINIYIVHCYVYNDIQPGIFICKYFKNQLT
jgi:hypothetical protein